MQLRLSEIKRKTYFSFLLRATKVETEPDQERWNSQLLRDINWVRKYSHGGPLANKDKLPRIILTR